MLMNKLDRIHKSVDKLQQKANQKYQRRSKKRLTALIIVMVALGGIVTAGLINYYASITSQITVEGVILIDGQEFPSISDELNMTVGSNETVNHTIQNLHDELTYNLSFDVTNVTEGLEVTILYLDNPITYVEVGSNTTITFAVRYHILPEADPNDTYESSIYVRYENSY